MAERILIGHGSGGKLMHQLLRSLISPLTGIEEFLDSAVLDINTCRVAFTTDSYVVSPVFFPGGDIGALAVNGTVNDLSVVGAEPMFLSLGLILEEGFEMKYLERILMSIKSSAEAAGVRVVTGDTKVVNKGKGDGIFINTSGIGIIKEEVHLTPKNVKPGDRVIVTGSIGNHGVAVMAERNNLKFDPPLYSDTKPLNDLVKEILKAGKAVHVMRDPTRGGLATTLKEIAEEASVCIEIEETKIPIKPQVRGACEILGLDPLFVANEGIIVAFVEEDMAEFLFKTIKSHPKGREAEIIGKVKPSPEGMVLLNTEMGGTRMIEMLSGEQLPRIC
jgi:hydrogenase expression/formation protein HypE